MEEQIEKIKKELKEKEIQNIYLNFMSKLATKNKQKMVDNFT